MRAVTTKLFTGQLLGRRCFCELKSGRIRSLDDLQSPDAGAPHVKAILRPAYPPPAKMRSRNRNIRRTRRNKYKAPSMWPTGRISISISRGRPLPAAQQSAFLHRRAGRGEGGCRARRLHCHTSLPIEQSRKSIVGAYNVHSPWPKVDENGSVQVVAPNDRTLIEGITWMGSVWDRYGEWDKIAQLQDPEEVKSLITGGEGHGDLILFLPP